MAIESSACAERGLPAPPEVVFNTATDPDQTQTWLPEQIRRTQPVRPAATAHDLRARWGSGAGWSMALQVHATEAGGAIVRLELAGDASHEQLTEIAEECLADLAREVTDRLTGI